MFRSISLILTIAGLTLSACAPQRAETPTLAVAPTETPAPLPSPPPTPAPRSLTICLGEEPNTLYLYDRLNAAARSVLSAVYDGPMDVREYAYEAVILEKVPSLED
ncbi:MAG TPA: hypothetical protein PLM89_11350, partial [Anaerolineales bacterium]|nr:hypothetical protein [Anaerolineales bacterium]